MSYDGMEHATARAMWVALAVVNVWLVFLPPRRTRAWPFIVRLLLPVIGFQVAVYGIYYLFFYPGLREYLRQNPYTLICGGLVRIPPEFWLLPGALFSLFLFGVRRALNEIHA